MALDLEHLEKHYQSQQPDLTDNMLEMTEHLRESCPVAQRDAELLPRSPVPEYWVSTRYDDPFKVLQEWQTFSSDADVRDSFGKLSTMRGDHRPPSANRPWGLEYLPLSFTQDRKLLPT